MILINVLNRPTRKWIDLFVADITFTKKNVWFLFLPDNLLKGFLFGLDQLKTAVMSTKKKIQDKTVAIELIYIHIDETQNYPFCIDYN